MTIMIVFLLFLIQIVFESEIVGTDKNCKGSFEYPSNSFSLNSILEMQTELNGTEITMWILKRKEGYLIAGFGYSFDLADVFYIEVNEKSHDLELKSCKLIRNELQDCSDGHTEGLYKLHDCKLDPYTLNWWVKISRNISHIMNVPISPTWNNFIIEAAEEAERPEDFRHNPEIFREINFLNFECVKIIVVLFNGLSSLALLLF